MTQQQHKRRWTEKGTSTKPKTFRSVREPNFSPLALRLVQGILFIWALGLVYIAFTDVKADIFISNADDNSSRVCKDVRGIWFDETTAHWTVSGLSNCTVAHSTAVKAPPSQNFFSKRVHLKGRMSLLLPTTYKARVLHLESPDIFTVSGICGLQTGIKMDIKMAPDIACKGGTITLSSRKGAVIDITIK